MENNKKRDLGQSNPDPQEENTSYFENRMHKYPDGSEKPDAEPETDNTIVNPDDFDEGDEDSENDRIRIPDPSDDEDDGDLIPPPEEFDEGDYEDVNDNIPDADNLDDDDRV